MSLVLSTEPVEALIISGPRRGQIVTVDSRLSEEAEQQVPAYVLEALRKLDAELAGVVEEARELRSELRDVREKMALCRTG